MLEILHLQVNGRIWLIICSFS